MKTWLFRHGRISEQRSHETVKPIAAIQCEVIVLLEPVIDVDGRGNCRVDDPLMKNDEAESAEVWLGLAERSERRAR
jgi:hypothetical protein